MCVWVCVCRRVADFLGVAVELGTSVFSPFQLHSPPLSASTAASLVAMPFIRVWVPKSAFMDLALRTGHSAENAEWWWVHMFKTTQEVKPEFARMHDSERNLDSLYIMMQVPGYESRL